MSGSATREKLAEMIPREGFIKTASPTSQAMPKEKRTALIRRGNEFFNKGDIDTARRIYMTTGYKAGLIRLGDYYYEKKQALEAFRMYKMATFNRSVNSMVEKMAMIISSWLNENKEG
jgi:hypothetical protein